MASQATARTVMLGAAALIWAASFGLAQAAEPAPAASDAPVTTTDSTSAQIADFLAEGAAPAPQTSGGALAPDGTPAPRRIHGEVGASIGSGGYRNAYGIVDIPIGANSDLGVAVSDTREAQHHGWGGGQHQSIALSLRLDGGLPTKANCIAHTGVKLPSDDQAAADCAKAAAP